MIRGLWVCLVWLMAGCVPEADSGNQWDGTYIGYYHHNQQDTTPVTLVFEGKYFAAAPHGKQLQQESTGIFQDNHSSLIFHNTTKESLLTLNGAYQYQFGLDGSIRIWQQNGDQMSEMILRQK